MAPSASDAVHRLFGKAPGDRVMAVYFSARFDEAGTDGYYDHAVLAGGVSRLPEWDLLEKRWDHLMVSRNVGVFHAKEFNAGDDDFEGWGRLKRSRFVKSMDKIIGETVSFDVAIAVDKKVHASVKEEMRGIRGFYPDSDVGLCFRMALFLACQKIKKIDSNAILQVIVEEGPYSANMLEAYERIRRTAGAKYKPAMFADMLAGFASVPKGELRSLEAADFLADRAISDIKKGRFTNPGRPHRISGIAGPEFLRWWHQEMLEERERRTNYGKRPNNLQSSQRNEPS